MEGNTKKRKVVMVRFHFMNNGILDKDIMALCEQNKCNGISDFVNKVLFVGMKEFLVFINYYCNNRKFKTVSGCRVNRKVSIPEGVYHGLKLCHKELDTYSIALIWRSFLIDVVECFTTGGIEKWEDFKRSVVEIERIREKEQRSNNNIFLHTVESVHIPGNHWQNISRAC